MSDKMPDVVWVDGSYWCDVESDKPEDRDYDTKLFPFKNSKPYLSLEAVREKIEKMFLYKQIGDYVISDIEYARKKILALLDDMAGE